MNKTRRGERGKIKLGETTEISYHTYLTKTEDLAVQKIAQSLVAKNELWDRKKKRFLKPMRSGRVSNYAVTQYALRLLLKMNGYDGELVEPDQKLREERKRRVL